jgi:hypothetical protein
MGIFNYGSQTEDQEEMITITKAEYDELIEDQKLLIALQGAGVDNWDGYDYAIESLDENNDEEN